MHCSLAWPDLSSALKVIIPCAEEKVWPRKTMCIATTKTFTGKLSRKAENPRKPRKFSHADVLPYTVIFHLFCQVKLVLKCVLKCEKFGCHF